jgi:hypothetical protein
VKPSRSLAPLLACALLAACAPAGVGKTGGGTATARVAEPGYALHDLPEWVPGAGFTLGRQVFLRPSQQSAISIGHERVHVRQQAASPLWFWWSYLTSARWRLRWEAEAYAVQARAGCPVDGDHGLAAYLSGPAYLWTASREEARRAILGFMEPAPLMGRAAKDSAAPGTNGSEAR